MYRLLPKIILSGLYSRQLRYKHSRHKIGNPGIEKRLKIIDNDIEFDDEDDLNYELDVEDKTNHGLTRKQELHQERERLKMLITRQKYFNVTQPNFLTWQEKEQIRYLHQSDPEEWSIEKLSDSFPALPEAIKKILSSQWKPKSEQRILNHDNKVTENWLKFQKNQINLDEILTAHLKKFMNRETVETILESTIRKPSVYEHKTLPPKQTEFLDIVKSDSKATIAETNSELNLVPNNILNVPKIIKNEHITLDCLKNVTNQENLKTGNVVEVTYPNVSKLESKFSELTVNISSEDCFQPIRKEGYAEVIKIPKKLWEKGKTYRVADCYYDDDGEFLYRVPGMVK
ncbi:neugrin [Chrysoperla carnea]|uniref:neugrin n=1 Tax=Chrysoperla carnea TaxID=189513 RepID=UPI001D05CA08|nr:neugrin [Chrysoperla carnea]